MKINMAYVQKLLDDKKLKEEADYACTAHQMNCGYLVTMTIGRK